MSKFAAAIASAADTTNMTKAQSGGGDYTPPAAGPTRLRLVGYVETGQHMGSYNGQPKKEDCVEVTFELSGPKHPPREHEGKKYPHLITLKLNKSLNEKAKFFKLFQILNWEGKAKHMAELLGKPFKGRVIHREYTIKGSDKKGIAAELWDKTTSAWTIEAPRYEKVNPEEHEQPGPTGEYLDLKVDPAISEERCLIWGEMGGPAAAAMWASIFIEGEYPEEKNEDGSIKRKARSKNVIQNKIKAAVNFEGSPVYAFLLNNGQPVDLPDNPADMDEVQEDEPEAPAKPTVDPLAGVGA